jgi:hypothetical protein
MHEMLEIRQHEPKDPSRLKMHVRVSDRAAGIFEREVLKHVR